MSLRSKRVFLNSRGFVYIRRYFYSGEYKGDGDDGLDEYDKKETGEVQNPELESQTV